MHTDVHRIMGSALLLALRPHCIVGVFFSVIIRYRCLGRLSLLTHKRVIANLQVWIRDFSYSGPFFGWTVLLFLLPFQLKRLRYVDTFDRLNDLCCVVICTVGAPNSQMPQKWGHGKAVRIMETLVTRTLTAVPVVTFIMRSRCRWHIRYVRAVDRTVPCLSTLDMTMFDFVAGTDAPGCLRPQYHRLCGSC